MGKNDAIFFQDVFEYPIKEFTKHLEDNTNSRILFSGKFGIGKTSFLKDYFGDENQENQFQEKKYVTYHLYPVNYSVSSNEDIIRYIKYDIVWELLQNHAVPNENKPNIGAVAKKYLKANLHKVLAALIYIIPKIGKDVYEAFNKWDSIKEEIIAFYEEETKTDGDKLVEMLEKVSLEEGGIYENDLITNIILDTIKINKAPDQTSVLIIDDLDRLDPEHVFRILNVFAAHFDYEREGRLNKFGFDKIIIVCDVNNIRNIFHHRYGLEVDFKGYVDKFYSSDIYYFDNRLAVSKIINKVLASVDFAYVTHIEKSFYEAGYLNNNFLQTLLNCLLNRSLISLRNILVIYNKKLDYHYEILNFNSTSHVASWKIPIAMQLKLLRLFLGDYKNMYKVFELCSIKNEDVEYHEVYFGYLIYILSCDRHSFSIRENYEYSFEGNSLFIETDHILSNGQIKSVNIYYNMRNDSESKSLIKGEYYHSTIKDFWKALLQTIDLLERIGYLK